jgi:uncharacterized protein
MKLLGLLLMSGLSLASATAAPVSADRLADLLPPELRECSFAPADTAAAERHSVYVPMADGVRLAVDIYLPKGASPAARLPTMYTATRYWRGERGGELTENQKRWIANGFALVNADVRGTGASFGQWYIPYSPQEAEDIGALAKWIAKQPWSNGKVVMTGNSYPGTTPMLALAYGTPAITAIAPKFSDFDMYTDLLWPGGVVAEDLIVTWGREVHEMDLNGGGVLGRGTQASVRPADGTDGEALLEAAVKEHQVNPWTFDNAAHELTFSDESSSQTHGLTIRDGGIYTHREAIERSGVPIFGWGSWLDSGIAQGLLNRYMSFSNPQLTIIGPWTHGARANANPFNLNAALDPPDQLQQQMIYCYLKRFALDEHPPAVPERMLVYFTMGEDRWKRTEVWPLPGTHQVRYYLDAAGGLSTQRPAKKEQDEYTVDFEASAGPANRWATQAGHPRIDFGNRAQADRLLLTYTSRPLPESVEVTGQPVIALRVASTHTDGNFIVYLEDVAPDGRVTYVTEGQLRALHRKLSDEVSPYRTTYPYRTFARKDALPLVPGQVATLTFQLQATSVLFKAGHRVRIAVAGADKGTFLQIPTPDGGDVILSVSRGGNSPSFIDLPVIGKRAP